MADDDIAIAGRRIGRDAKPFVVAEMSGNHNRSLERALTIVETLDLSQTTWWELAHPRIVQWITFVARRGLQRYPHTRGSMSEYREVRHAPTAAPRGSRETSSTKACRRCTDQIKGAGTK